MDIRRTTTELSTSLFLCLIVLSISISVSTIVVAKTNCEISVTDEIHVAPAAELATTKGYPDIITLENSHISVTSIPNRGRLLFDYQFKKTGNPLTFTNKNPLPLETEKGFFLEFGGFYTSYPWNDRANQPFDMEYEIMQKSGDQCSIKVYRDDPDLNFGFEAFLSIKSNAPVIKVNLKFTNNSQDQQELGFDGRLIASPGAKMSEEARVEFPEEVDRIRVIKSSKDWMGKPEEEKTWPQPWQEWGNYKGEGIYSVSIKDAEDKFVKVTNPESGDFIRLVWSDGFSEAEVLSWGTHYEDTMGAYPAFNVRLNSRKFSLAPGASETFNLRFIAGRS